MRPSALVLAAAASLTLACAPGEVVVTAEVEVPDQTQEGATRVQSLADVEVQLLPFDRDLVFDSLSQAAENPEPPIPEDVLEAQDSIATAQTRWQQLEARWSTLRDTLQTINSAIERYTQAERRYRELFNEWQDLNAQYERVDRQRQRAFAYFTELSDSNLERKNEIRIQRENWANEAFRDVDPIFLLKEREAGREIVADTTDAQGIAHFESLKKGRWWITARYELPFTELYWNVMVDVQGGEPVTIRLTRSNAEERPKL